MKLIFEKKFTIKDTKSYAKKSGDKNRIHIDKDVEKFTNFKKANYSWMLYLFKK